jgi:hypothetical protein
MKKAWLLGIAFLAVSVSLAQNQPSPCQMAKGLAGPEANVALDRIISVVGFNPRVINLRTSSDALVSSKGGAFSFVCNDSNSSQQWIVYDPDRIRGDSVRDFVFAHELAHHLNAHTVSGSDTRSTQEELDADYYGARYLVRLGWTREQLLSALNQLNLPQGAQRGYPSIEERRAAVNKGFNDEHRPGAAGKAAAGSGDATGATPKVIASTTGLVGVWRGRYGMPLYFQGNDDVVYPDQTGTDLPNGSSWTLEAWIYPIGNPSGMHIMGKRGYCNGNDGFYQIALDKNTPTTGMSVDPAFTPPQSWTHVAIAASSTGWVSYVNGTAVKTVSAPGFRIQNNSQFMIGGSGIGCPHFKGAIDYVSLYSRALSESEILATYSTQRPHVLTEQIKR